MLDTTRSGTFVAGSNRIVSATGAALLSLLPAQAPGRAVVVGVPNGGVLPALGFAAGSLTVRCRTQREARRARRLLGGAEARIEIANGPGETGTYDFVYVARGASGWGALFLRDALPGTAFMIEESGGTRLDVPGSRSGTRILLRPALGEITAAVPETAPNARLALEGRGLWSGAIVARAFGRSRELRGRWLRTLPERRLVAGDTGPPAYLRRVAAEAGIDIGGYGWSMSAPGRYRSNKILFFLFEPGSAKPKLVVKITRAPELNGRLEIEREALRDLNAAGTIAPSTIPRVTFFGEEAGKAVIGLTAIEGKPFTAVTEATAACPHAARAFAWLTDLGAATSTPAPDGGRELGRHLREILDRFLALYDVEPRHRTVLEEQIGIIEHSPEPFPVVFQHGDPGVWNLLVAENGSVAFLDWEAAERRGVPLWDVFHLARSYAVTAGRAGGERNMLRAIDRILFDETPINEMVAGVVRRYRERVRVPPALIEPLFHTSWMHRALKEATRLPKHRLGGGHYLALLKRGIDRRRTTALARLFGGEDGGIA